MRKLVECVPNISEGRDKHLIAAVTGVVEATDGVTLLDVDPGADTNRTVITFVGEPDAVVEAALQMIKKAALQYRRTAFYPNLTNLNPR